MSMGIALSIQKPNLYDWAFLYLLANWSIPPAAWQHLSGFGGQSWPARWSIKSSARMVTHRRKSASVLSKSTAILTSVISRLIHHANV
jgi:hypothetical protein